MIDTRDRPADDEIEVTEAMIEAGLNAFFSYNVSEGGSEEDRVLGIKDAFRAMLKCQALSKFLQ